MMNEMYNSTSSLDFDEVSGGIEQLALCPRKPSNRSNRPYIFSQRWEYLSDYREFKDKKPVAHLSIPQFTYEKFDKQRNSSTSLKLLTRTTISNLHLDIPAQGTYLLLRTLECAFKLTGFHTFVEDHTGDGTLFCAYNMLATDDCQEVFPVGIVFIVKEPLLVKSVTGRYMLQCYSPTDIVILQEGHKYYYLTKGVVWKNKPSTRPYPDSEYEKQKSADEWKTLGNEMFKKEKFIHATRFYCRGLYEAEKTTDKALCLVLHLELSATYLSSGWYESTIKAAERALEIDPTCLKAHFRAGRANYELRKYAESKQWFSKLVEIFPNYEKAKKELQRCESRLEEAHRGSHSIYRMVLESTCRPRQPVDCADFTGPIRMVNIPGKGLGYVATKDLNPGTLLLVNKALNAVWWKGKEIESTVMINELISEIANILLKNPNTFSSSFYSLPAEPFEIASGETLLFCDSELREEPIVHVDKIRRIINTNYYAVNGWPHESYIARIKTDSFFYTVSEILRGINYKTVNGVFLLASFFNHRCVSNAVCNSYNDVIFVQAIQHIKEGEEVFLPGCPPEALYHERISFYERLRYSCDCRLCLADAREQPLRFRYMRDYLLTTFHDNLLHFKSKYGVVQDLKDLIEYFKITFMRSNHQEFQFYLFVPYLLLGALLNYYRLYDEEAQALMNALRTFGFEPDELLTELRKTNTVTIKKWQFLNLKLIPCLELLIDCYMHSGDVRSAKNWIRIMIEFDRILSGGNLESFKVKYNVIRKLCDYLQI